LARGLALSLFLLAGLALASCEGFPYVLKTPLGELAGERLSYREGVLELEPACLTSEGRTFFAERARFYRAEGRLVAEGVRGEGLSAERLVAEGGRATLFGVTYGLEGGWVRAPRAELEDGRVRLEAPFGEVSGRRFFAREGLVTGGRFEARGVWATSCREGRRVALAADGVRVEEGLLRLASPRLRYAGLCLPLPDPLVLDLDEPPEKLPAPVFSLFPSPKLGLSDLPLPDGRGVLSAQSPLLSLALGGEGFSLALKEGARGLEAKLSPLNPRFSLKDRWVRARLGGEGFGLELGEDLGVFAALEEEGATAGLFSRGRGRAGPVRWSFALRLGGGTRGGFFASRGRVAYARGPWTLGLGLDLARGEVPSWAGREGALGVLELGHRGPLWARARLGLGGLFGRFELALGRELPDPPPYGVALAPEVGYDLGLGRLARLGLAVAFDDGCLVYRLAFGYVALPWPGEAEGVRLAMGVALP